ncbi:solute carrier family 16 member 7 [Homo sapiens]|uniref:Solute carrier family 16 member 7 n=1 Tax=Homo sapiens TaxID=9606 RepID=F8VQS4_HUMAN|nr:solute carrier family 16 member 7 [Homo sapiens]
MPPMPSAPPVHPPPDGGWGWIVVGAAFISIGFSYAFPKAVTVFFKEIQQIFHTTYSEIAWISSIMLAVMYAGGRMKHMDNRRASKAERSFTEQQNNS